MSTAAINQNTPAAATDTGSQLAAENRSVEVDGATLVFRRFGTEPADAPPLVCLQQFRGNLDFWDPTLVDRIARDREVILHANRGVGARRPEKKTLSACSGVISCAHAWV
jgi:pimeloyl-ACP methyl ester carboxylesterase